MRLLLIAAVLFGASAAHAETDFYDVICTTDQVGHDEFRFSMSIASGQATIGATSTTPIDVAMYENAFVWDAGGAELLLDRFSGRLTRSIRGADGKRTPAGPVYQCRKSGGKRI